MNSYVIIGLGRFGTEMAVKLFECGEEVLAIDLDEQLVDK
ncbi:MAG: NAD-binding protein, partial [Clostridiales bacterium]|nr:NAD-binding protein [Clostridiales bacterium]